MAWYFNKHTAGFMTTLICGERTLQIPDPNWQPDPKREGEEQRAPLVTIENPDCILPPETLLWPLSDAEYAALIQGQELGKTITADPQGYPVLLDRPPPTQEQIQIRQMAEKTQRIVVATDHKAKLAARIATLSDAVANIDRPGMEAFAATPDEQDELVRCQSALVQWKNYAIALGRIVPTGDPIQWPKLPDS